MADLAHGMPSTVGEVDHARNGFNPTDILTDFDYGKVSELDNGQTLREYDFIALDKMIEVAPGIEFPAWTYNGRVPGPTIRCTEGDRIRINFANGSAHPHTIHFHGIHPFEMDGVPGAGGGLIQPGQRFTYEFDAEPFGVHLYHCHAFPLARHIAKGLYGAWIGGFASSPTLAVLFLAIGAGAIFQVVYEVTKLIRKDTRPEALPLTVFSGVVAGMLLLWVTGLFIK